MSSPSRPLPDPSRLGIMFWLPPGGVDNIKRPGRRAIHRLWVDSLQYHRAEEVLMAFLHNRSGGRAQPESPGF